MSTATPVSDEALLRSVVEQVRDDLGLLANRPLALTELRVERRRLRVPGSGRVHIAFRMGLERGPKSAHGCALLPLADAVSLASYLLMHEDGAVQQARESGDLDGPTKGAVVEVAHFLAGSVDEALRSQGVRVRAEGCQGVREDCVPSFSHSTDEELLVGWAQMKLAEFAPFELILMLPLFEDADD